jgi:exodeoxyribonuclease V alpha subunit
MPWLWIDPDKALLWVAERLKLTFADSQTTAIRQALACKVLVITGCPASAKPPSSRAFCKLPQQPCFQARGAHPCGETQKQGTDCS